MSQRVIHGLAEDVLPKMRPKLFDCMVTDPPAGIGYQGREWDRSRAQEYATQHASVERRLVAEAGLSKSDARDATALLSAYLPPPWVLWLADVFRGCKRVLKPGAYAAVWAFPRTAHWTAHALEIAGFNIRTQFAHIHAKGTPKSMNVAHAIDKHFGKPRPAKAPAITHEARRVEGHGTAFNDGHEVWWIAQVPREGTYVETSLRYGTGCIDWPAIADAEGRVPKDVALSEDAAALLDVAARFFYVAKTSTAEREFGLDHLQAVSAGAMTRRKDGSKGLGNPRAGAGRTAGRANTHPTVKPLSLCRYLIRGLLPPGGRGLDPFAGSGSILCAATLEAVPWVGIEADKAYCEIAEARVKAWAELRPVPDLDLNAGTVAREVQFAPPGGHKIHKIRMFGAIENEMRKTAFNPSDTVRRAIQHWFGLAPDPGGSPAPAGWLAGLEFAPDIESPAGWGVYLSPAEYDWFPSDETRAATLRHAVVHWLGAGYSGPEPANILPRDYIRRKLHR